MSDELSVGQLVEKARNGSEEGFRELYRTFAPKARGTLRHMVGPNNLDDLVQDVFERVWKNMNKIRDTASFSTWFYRITWNVAMDARHSLALARAREGASEKMDLALCEKPSAEQQVNAKLAVEMALNELDFEHRSVLVLAEYEELSVAEIAVSMGIPEGTVKSRLFHARKKVRGFLEAKGVMS